MLPAIYYREKREDLLTAAAVSSMAFRSVTKAIRLALAIRPVRGTGTYSSDPRTPTPPAAFRRIHGASARLFEWLPCIDRSWVGCEPLPCAGRPQQIFGGE